MKFNKGAIMRSIEQPFVRNDHPTFETGDTVRVDYKVVEGNRSRIQSFEGVVIARKNGTGARTSITVRKVSFGEGVERVFPLASPLIDKIEIVKRGRTRRSKLYYLRELRGKAARLQTDVGRQEADRAAARDARATRLADAAAAEEAEARAAAEAAEAAEQAEAAEANDEADVTEVAEQAEAAEPVAEVEAAAEPVEEVPAETDAPEEAAASTEEEPAGEEPAGDEDTEEEEPKND